MLCASQAATSIRLSTDESGGSTTTTSTIYLGGNSTSSRLLDRHNPIIRDAARITKVLLLNTSAKPPCSSNPPPITPKQKSSRKENTNTNTNTNTHQTNKKIISSSSKRNDNSVRRKSFSSWSCTKPSEFISPPGSSRYLLSNQKSSFVSDHFDPLLALGPNPTPRDQQHVQLNKDDDNIAVFDHDNITDSSSSANSSKLSNSSISSASSAEQVVVLKVSLHCKGCEKKMKKHLSKMQGVTSFTIDFAAKKLTVVGDVTPLSVLASVSKVKNAQLLTPTLSSSVAPA